MDACLNLGVGMNLSSKVMLFPWLGCGRTILAIAMLIVCAFNISAAQAQSQNNLMRIAAVVNDDIISVLDL